ncbi:hypothetical protein FHL15_003642 [Xylaria flabelliformis]|uniref:Protein kinase domain-containing protein n=1 Tax=Xylaria flabelliformis TaxID=2512241 RepID=A0A553I530_9PEZI|nr:hypothetical protein FHL15_003642 [Xylaria flabelliformis]
MATATSSIENGAPSPRSFAQQHQRPRESFKGCSRITDYELQGKLGEGTFGEVHKARSRRTGALVALKKIIMHNEKDGFPITALREIKLLKLLSHKNVLRLEDMAVEHHTKMSLRYLHENKILHRDMKAANLLISNKGILQIADFGLARHYDGNVPQAGQGGGEGKREYTSLVVTRWYRPPELLLHLKRYTTAIDMWGVGCVFGEMLVGKPILAGESDAHQLEIIFDLVGSPTEENMPGWKQLPGAESLTPRPRPGSLPSRFREHGPVAISLLKELLQLNWRTRINAIDALEHPYFKTAPYPARPEDIPTFEDSHEFDRRKFHDRKAALPPAPKGGTVGGAFDGPNVGFGSGDGYGNRGNGRHHGGNRNGDDGGRRPAWAREQPRHEHRLPPRPPPPENPPSGWDATKDQHDSYNNRDRDRDRDRGPRNRGGANIDTYIPSYRGGRDERPPREDRPPRDDRRRRDDREERRHDWDRRDRDYEDRSRASRTRSRSRSPIPVRDRDRDVYRR